MSLESLTQLSNISTLPVWAIVLVTIWTLIWKGLALWKSAKKNSKVWFIVLLIINTLGILEILYIFLFSKINLNKSSNYNNSKSKKPVSNKKSSSKKKSKK